WIGEDHFRDGLRVYLRDHRFGNATIDDLASALRNSSGIEPDRMMHAFLDTPGVPEIRGELLCDRAEVPALRISKTGSGPVPVCWRADRVESTCTVLEGISTEVDLPKGTACPTWFYLNSGGTGYYRTAWTQAPMTAIPQLSAAERLALVYDL